MKLNNKGWGTLQMILLSLGLFVALLVAIYFIGRLYGNLDNAVKNKQYNDLENKLEIAARDYITTNNLIVYDMQHIYKSTLVSNGYLDNLLDGNGNSCDGYVTIRIMDGINYYYGYISCPNYQTRNY